jgi:hypothetical protein
MRTLASLCLLLVASWAWAESPGKEVSPPKGKSNLVVHEWGTFLSVQGSDGSSLGGMVDSDEILPSFVESRGLGTWQRSQMRLKMETPVTYFYTDRPCDVQVRVEMPKGILTHWYPGVKAFGPALKPSELRAISSKPEVISTKRGQVFTGLIRSETPTSVELIDVSGSIIKIAKKDIDERATAATVKLVASEGNSFLDWRNVHLVPDTQGASRKPAALLKPVTAEQTWRYVRETDSALVQVKAWVPAGQNFEHQTAVEKFLFYRGLGTFDLPLEIRSTEAASDLQLTLRNKHSQSLQGMFVIRVEKDTIQFASLGDLEGNASRLVSAGSLFSAPLPCQEGVPLAKSAVASALVSAGLFPKEAQAMVNTWERSYFRTEGLRMLFLLPHDMVNSAIPIQIRPAPEKLVRVMVGRIEMLTPGRERQIEKLVAELGAKEFKIREAATSGLARLGRISEPALRRITATSNDPEVRHRAEALISKIGK